MNKRAELALGEGDEIVVSRLDHDANVSPWLYAAEEAGVVVRFCDIETDDLSCQLTPENMKAVLSERTRLVTFCSSSSSVGTRPDSQVELERRSRVKTIDI